MRLLFYNSFNSKCEDVLLLDYTNIWIGEQYERAIRYFVDEAKKQGIECKAFREDYKSEADAYVLWELPRKSMGELENSAYRYILGSGKPIYIISTEPPIVSPEGGLVTNSLLYDKIFTWRKELIDNKKYYPIRPMFFDFDCPAGYNRKYSDKKLCVMIGHILSTMFTSPDAIYNQRKSILDWFRSEHPGDIDLYGKQPYGVGQLKQYPFFKGAAKSKRETLTHYKFNFCYENSRYPEYITEKLFDCFISGCVPIYLGAPNVNEKISRDAYIDPREFSDMQSLYNYISNMPEEQYIRYQKAGKEVLQTDFARSYLPKSFTNAFLSKL